MPAQSLAGHVCMRNRWPWLRTCATDVYTTDVESSLVSGGGRQLSDYSFSNQTLANHSYVDLSQVGISTTE